MQKRQEPKNASMIVTLQVAFPPTEPRRMEKLVADLRALLEQENPTRVTVLDEYWLVKGVRTTAADLSAKAPAKEPEQAESEVEFYDDNDSSVNQDA